MGTWAGAPCHCYPDVGEGQGFNARWSSDRKHTTVREHMPSSHRRYADWTPERLRRQADAIGRNTSALVEIILREPRILSEASALAPTSYGSRLRK